MSDYKATLNLPYTDFPMKANLSAREPAILKRWQENDLYNQLRNKRQGKKTFVLLDGPPYANGHIHIGHAVNKILKDIVVKSKSLCDLDAPFIPGWDCHGLPIEINVEKKQGKPGVKISREAFRVACRDYAAQHVDIQREEFMRLGVLADWAHPYLTMDYQYEADIIRSLGHIIKNGHFQKGYKPVQWCLDCGSALAEAEVEYADKTSPAIDVRFTVQNPELVIRLFNLKVHASLPIIIPVWTTTPWTLPANEAVALNKTLDYTLIATDQEILIIATDLLSEVTQRFQLDDYNIVGNIRGEKLEGLQLKHPFYDKTVPLVFGEHVTAAAGTGAVHTAPAHGIDDYLIGKRYHLPLISPVGNDGCYTQDVPLFAGLHVNKANERIIETLQAHHTLIHLESIQHSYPHCWRHKTPVILRATPQWFVNLDQAELRSQALTAIEKVEWHPTWGQARIEGMVRDRPDWCLSRQRTWGVPIALFIHKETGELHPRTQALIEMVAKQVEQSGAEAWYQLQPESLLGEEASHYEKVTDVLDVWFDSGVAHFAVLNKQQHLPFPADLVLEGSDQYRGWFQSLLLTAVAMHNQAPYQAVLTHGFVVDGKGKKMSKSQGNVIAPEEVTKTLGADILRLWVASIDYRVEITASIALLTTVSETYRRIRNTARFLLANLHDFDPDLHIVDVHDMLTLDLFITEKAQCLQTEIIEAYDAYQFHLVVQKIQQFCISELGGFYLDIIKDRQYTMHKESRGRRSAQTALYHVAQALVRWLAPILSFTAEEIWDYLPGKKDTSVLLTTWYASFPQYDDQIAKRANYWNVVRTVRDAVNKEIETQRNASVIGSALEAEVYLYCASPLYAQLSELKNELRFVLITSAATVLPESDAPSDAAATEVPGLRVRLVATQAPKCDRCWHRVPDVNSHAAYPGLCNRCVENVSGQGEVRHYA